MDALSDDLSPEKEALIESIAHDYLEALRDGRDVDLQELVGPHEELADLIRGRLELMRVLHEATVESAAGDDGSDWGLRCPHCALPVDVDDPPPAEMQCPACGSAFAIGVDASVPGMREDQLPEVLGKFRLHEVLGRGAFGTVYWATDTELDRKVTLKVPRAGIFGSREEEIRFYREARSAASLRHPGIVQVYEVTEIEGIPVIVREYIAGQTLEELLEVRKLTSREIAELVATVAEALQHAHDQGVVHRDIKPANILIDRERRPHITDFGLARRDEGEVTMTLDGQILGTPAYMSPEQAGAKHDQVDARSDVYSLGVVLYEVLTGVRPFSGQRSMVIHQVIHDEPKAPRRLNEHLPRDLETICLRAMEKDRERRYASAHLLAADLKRFLNGEPVIARPISGLERFGRWCRRKPVLAGLAGTLLFVVTAGVIASVVAAWRFEQTAAHATRQVIQLNTSAAIEKFDDGDFFASLPFVAEVFRLETDPRRLGVHRLRVGAALARCPRLIQMWFHDDAVLDATFGNDARLVATASADSTARVWDRETGEPLSPALNHGGAVNSVRFSPDGETLVTACEDGKARVWSWAIGKLSVPPFEHGDRISRAVFSPDGKLIATACDDGTAGLWEASPGRQLHLFQHQGRVRFVDFSPDSERVVTAGSDRLAVIWSTAKREPLLTLKHATWVGEARFSPDGRFVGTTGEFGAQVWDATTGGRAGPTLPHFRGAHCIAFSPDAQRVVTGGRQRPDGRVWNWRTGEPLTPELDLLNVQVRVAFSPDGRSVAVAAYDGRIAIFGADTGKREVSLPRQGGIPRVIEFGPDGHLLLTANGDGTARLWDLARRQPRLRRLIGGRTRNWATFSANGEWVLTWTETGSARIWESDTGYRHRRWFRHDRRRSIWTGDFSPDSELAVTGASDNRAKIWNVRTGELVMEIVHDHPVIKVRFSPDGALLATVEMHGAVHAFKVADWTPTPFAGRFDGTDHPYCVAFSPDGQRLAAGSGAGRVKIWDPLTGEEKVVLDHGRSVFFVAFLPDGRRLLSAGDDGVVRLWSTETGEALRELVGHHFEVRSLALAADGRHVLTAGRDGAAVLWDVDTGHVVSKRMVHATSLNSAALSPNGTLAATAGFHARVWDAVTGEAVTPILDLEGSVLSVEFSPDGSQLVTAGFEREIRLWDLPNENRPINDLIALLHLLANRRIDGAGDVEIVDRATLLVLWKRLRSKYPDEFQQQRSEIVDWHVRETARARREKHLEAALFHLERRIALDPEGWRHRHVRAVVHQDLGRLVAAFADETYAIMLLMRELGHEASLGARPSIDALVDDEP